MRKTIKMTKTNKTKQKQSKKIKSSNYAFTIRPLTKEEGGGYLIEYPDLPGCMSDGETIEEAIANGIDAINCWVEASKAIDRKVPKASGELQSGKWVQRVPKSLHAKLVMLAKREGVSLNTMVITLLAGGLGLHHQKRYKVC